MHTREKEQRKIVPIGQVLWVMEGSDAGYISGLERIADKIHAKEGPEFFIVHIFCREVAIAVDNPTETQSNPVLLAQKCIEQGLLSQDECQYVYAQFGFDPQVYEEARKKRDQL